MARRSRRSPGSSHWRRQLPEAPAHALHDRLRGVQRTGAPRGRNRIRNDSDPVCRSWQLASTRAVRAMATGGSPRASIAGCASSGIFGQRSAQKRVPAAVFRLSNEQIATIPAAPLGDGRHDFAHGSRVSAAVMAYISQPAVVGSRMMLRHCLLRLGIVARIQTVTSGYKSPVHMVWVRGVRVADVIPRLRRCLRAESGSRTDRCGGAARVLRSNTECRYDSRRK